MAAPVTKPLNRPQTRTDDTAHQRVRSFWDRVTEGLELAQLWNQFKMEARTGYRLYSREVDIEKIAEGTRSQRFFSVAKSFFWAILIKMSPARRIILLVAIALLIIPALEINWESRHLTINATGGQTVAAILLLSLLLMEIADRVTLKRDLQIAREIQMWLVPETAPVVPGLEVAFFNRPANTVAGDYYDVFRRAGNDAADAPVVITVADVAGKSLPAALLMATLQASLHTLSIQPTSLLELTQGLNRYACEHSRGGQRFTTAFIAEYDPISGALTYINAGHNAPMLLRANAASLTANAAIERLDIGGVPLGIMPLAAYQCATVTLQPGDTLVIFTDGLVEAVNAADKEYGDDRVKAAICGNRQRNARDLLAGMVRALDVFVGITPQHDDITCLVARRTS